MIDKKFFLYDLAIVAIMKSEAPYVKEWLDYHLLAGVEHFYIYDNDSPDNLKEVLQPYIDKGVVTYIFYPGKARQYEAYNEAFRKYRFFCRYMAFIDGDEFLFPKNNKSVSEVIDEVLSDKNNVGGLGVNMLGFGSNYQDKADYSCGVLERFTRRMSETYMPPSEKNPDYFVGVAQIKTIANPRKIDFFYNPHFPIYLPSIIEISSSGIPTKGADSIPPCFDKIVLNHYYCKSREEWAAKVMRGTADAVYNVYKLEQFTHETPENEVFDDTILAYVEARKKLFLKGKKKKKQDVLSVLPLESEQARKVRVTRAVNDFLVSLDPSNLPENFFKDRLEQFLLCFAVGQKFNLKTKDNVSTEEISLTWSLQSLRNFSDSHISNMALLFSELPNIMFLPYNSAKLILRFCVVLMPSYIEMYKVYDRLCWREFTHFQYLLEILKKIDDKNFEG